MVDNKTQNNDKAIDNDENSVVNFEIQDYDFKESGEIELTDVNLKSDLGEKVGKISYYNLPKKQISKVF